MENAVFCFVIMFYLLNSKTSVATNLTPFNSISKSISLFLIADSVPSGFSSGLKELKIST